ncbi:methyl-accepting chemotaxis protein [Gymnodinialimonas sp. 2305UL16-5]|uniref:methyl-accepting chemotaxis protein n=1 Tax=Gymnodinialimonas mytili TaxID=3126503 RepID=UPI00309CA37D
MSKLKKLPLAVRLIIVSALMLIVMAGTLTFVGHHEMRQTLKEFAQEENVFGARALMETLEEIYPEIEISTTAAGAITQIIWPVVPDSVPADAADTASEITGLDPTIFAFDRGTQSFVRVATTILNEDGGRAIGTPLARNEAYHALIDGAVFNGLVDIQGVPYNVYYRPILNESGTVTGAIALAQPHADLQASLQTKLDTKMLWVVVALSVMLPIAYLVMRSMLSPLGKMTKLITGMSEGRFDDAIPYDTRGDELGEIANSLKILQNSLRAADELKQANAARQAETERQQAEQRIVVTTLTEGLSKLSQLDLTVRIQNTDAEPFPAEYETLRTSFNELVDQLTETVSSIQVIAEEVTGDAREMAGSSSDLSSRTESQAATLQESAAALEELSQSVQSTAENAADAETTTNENREVTKATGEVVTNAIAAMEAIEASSQQINQIISVIDDIAFQTNLLALNAGVEAARAGEAGRGFAVVASEVRALAQHSSASAQEIKSLIAASSQQVETGSGLVRDAGKALNDIIDRVDRVAGLVSDIAVSAKEQSVGVSEINAGVRDLDAATQSNAAMAEEASAASEGLTNAAEKMTARLARFRLEGQAARANWAAAAVVSMADTPTDTGIAPIDLKQAASADPFRGF